MFAQLMELGYVKDMNETLHNHLADPDVLNLLESQNYNPLLGRFFELRHSNSKHLTLNHPLRLVAMHGGEGQGKFRVEVEDRRGTRRHTTAFFKFSPILDPLRYATGRYGQSTAELLALPDVEHRHGHEKSRGVNNAAYVDGFFSYLTAGLLHNHGFLHGLDSFACFLSRKKNFLVDVADDMDHLASSEFFAKHEGDLFHFDAAARARFSQGLGSGRRRTPLRLCPTDPPTVEAEEADTAHSIKELDSIFSIDSSEDSARAPGLELVFATKSADHAPMRRSERDSSSCSSRSSGTDDGSPDDDGEEYESHSELGSGSDAGTISSIGDDSVFLSVSEFPVCTIALESCEATLDQLMVKKGLSAEEWESAMFQVVVSLLAFKRAFRLTHNDLHTNNIMYKHTDKQYLCYKINGQLYRVPTYGRLYKIIDFGRSIYEYKGERMCSDSFAKHGDAATQYNCEPFMNSKRPRLDPNPSFDLCRLGCSLYDHLMDEYEGSKFRPPAVVEMMMSWCNDDKGRNIMYKANGVERYPDFKLYKMIARTVHQHTPEKALLTPCMQRYKSSRSDIGKKTRVMSIDSIPDYSGHEAVVGRRKDN